MYRFSMSVVVLAAVGLCSVAVADDKPKQEKPKIPDRVYIKMSTSMGDIYLELNQEKAPISTKNFVDYAKDGYYNGTIFHRVISNFMIQGGGFDKDMQKKETKAPIKNEWRNGLKNGRGAIAMARTSDPDSATSQFFINVVNNPFLDQPRGGAAYAVFGKVIDGMDVVDEIRNVPTTTRNGMENVPEEPVIIKTVEVLDADSPAVKKALEAEKRAAEKEFHDAMKLVKEKGGDPDSGVKTASGLWYVDLKKGEGKSPEPTDTVEVHYTGWLTSGKKFDSSRDRGKPATFPLNRVIKGWTEGVGSMQVGGHRILVIPYNLAYGERGHPPVIPPKAMLVFDVELLSIK